jgi:hypothetical protein
MRPDHRKGALAEVEKGGVPGVTAGSFLVLE